MRPSIRLGRIAGIEVGANWSVLVIVALVALILGGSVLPVTVPHHSTALYWAIAIPGAVVFLASLLAHELAHALVARRNGVRVRSITLWMLGGMTDLEGEPKTARVDFAIAVVGPLTSVGAGLLLSLAGAGLYAVGGPAFVTVTAAAFVWLGVMNGFLAVFNLLPGAPLDGGRILRAAIWWLRGNRTTAERVATRAGKGVGVVLIGIGLVEIVVLRRFDGLWLALIGWFLAGSAGQEQRANTVRSALAGVRVRDVMTPHPAVAPAWSSIGVFVEQIAMVSRQTVFPVVTFDGDPVGVVTLEMLSQVSPERVDDRVQTVAVALPAAYVAGPDDLVEPLLHRIPLAGRLSAVVVGDGQVVGMVTTDDLDRLVQLRSVLGTRRPREAEQPVAAAHRVGS